jgi:hypothetical protein
MALRRSGGRRGRVIKVESLGVEDSEILELNTKVSIPRLATARLVEPVKVTKVVDQVPVVCGGERNSITAALPEALNLNS